MGFCLLMVSLVNLGFSQAPQKFIVSSPEAVGISSERLKWIDAILQTMINEGIVPNAVTFVARKGKVVHY
jgi:hypothetical protein